MSANPWNPATFTNASVVKTNTPDEVNALKQVNLDRPRAGYLGHATYTLPMTDAIGPLFINNVGVKIPYINTVLYKGANAAGEYTCDQSGLYRCEAQVVNPLSGVANMLNYFLTLQKYSSGSWANFMQTTFDCASSGAQNSALCSSYVSLVAGEKLRMAAYGLCSVSTTHVVPIGAADVAFWYIEFLRQPA